MAKREFLQLAHKLTGKTCLGGWYYSTKLDGVRGLWDGGVTRGMLKKDVPFANHEKDERYVEGQVCSGLWSRYGNVIQAPPWFIGSLPQQPLEGEFYGGLNGPSRQIINGMISKIVPDDDDWTYLSLYAFDMPNMSEVLADGHIDVTNFHKHLEGCVQWYDDLRWGLVSMEYDPMKARRFESAYTLMRMMHDLEPSAAWVPHTQWVLDLNNGLALETLQRAFVEHTTAGHEGLMVRNPNSTYECCRSHNILKVKELEVGGKVVGTDDAEGIVVGYITGRKTDKGSKLLGKMGGLIVKLDSGNLLVLSGFTDEERELVQLTEYGNLDKDTKKAEEWAILHPDTEVHRWIEAKYFPRGMRVTFKYRGLTDAGIPNEARYWRNA